MVVAVAAVPDGGKLLVIFDATSTLSALFRFQRLHNRKRCMFYCDRLLDVLDRELQRLSVVVALWQPSHLGSPPNEWADVEAGEAMTGEDDVPRSLASVCARLGVQARHYSIRLAAPSRGPLAWAKAAADVLVHQRMMATVQDTLLRQSDDLGIGCLPDKYERVASAVLAQRACIGDAKRFRTPAVAEAAAEMGYPMGCVGPDGRKVACTWQHIQFFCCGDMELESARRRWIEGEVGGRRGVRDLQNFD
eukprot:3730304-Prymnesium_polylepis.1